VKSGLHRLTLHILDTVGEKARPESCQYSCTLDWLANVLLVKLSRWSQELHLNIEARSLRLVDIASYSATYQRLKEKYGRHLVNVSVWYVFMSVSVTCQFLDAHKAAKLSYHQCM